MHTGTVLMEKDTLTHGRTHVVGPGPQEDPCKLTIILDELCAIYTHLHRGSTSDYPVSLIKHMYALVCLLRPCSLLRIILAA
jgi:hypothetical protein